MSSREMILDTGSLIQDTKDQILDASFWILDVKKNWLLSSIQYPVSGIGIIFDDPSLIPQSMNRFTLCHPCCVPGYCKPCNNQCDQS